MPSSSSARMTRMAISPRLATRTLENTAARISAGGRRAPTPGDPLALLLVDLPRVDGAVFVGVEHPQAHAGARGRVPERRHRLGRVGLGPHARCTSVMFWRS